MLANRFTDHLNSSTNCCGGKLWRFQKSPAHLSFSKPDCRGSNNGKTVQTKKGLPEAFLPIYEPNGSLREVLSAQSTSSKFQGAIIFHLLF
jgi:hypothetical protein